MLYKPQQKTSFANIVAVSLLIAGVALAYGYLITSYAQTNATPEKNTNLFVTPSQGTLNSPFSPEQLALLAKIESLKLDSTLFGDLVFKNLQDWTVELVPEPVGKANPFAPLGSIQAQSSASTSAQSRTPRR